MWVSEVFAAPRRGGPKRGIEVRAPGIGPGARKHEMQRQQVYGERRHMVAEAA